MSSVDLEDPWGLLVSIESEEEERIPIVGRGITIGRGKDMDLVIPGNKFVSTAHCELTRGKDGGVWITDTSTNGTLLNGGRLVRHSKMKLANDDIIRIVHRKDRPDCNVAYRYQELQLPSEDSTLELTEKGDSTLELTEVDDATPELREDRVISGEEGSTGTKKRSLEEPAEVPSAKRTSQDRQSDKTKEMIKLKSVSSNREKDGKDSGVRSAGAEKVEGKGQQLSEATPKPPALVKEDSIELTLLCQICQEILHDCVSLQPCLHSYCAGCYSDWMTHSDTCPCCRNMVERISKNHIVNNLVAAYLRANPDKKREEEDLKELDAKNKITKDMLYPKRKNHYYSDSDGSETEGSSSPTPETFTTIFRGVRSAPLFLCRQCPGYVDSWTPPTSISTSTHTFTSSSLSHPPIVPPSPYTCSSSTNHVLCMCCLQPMPDRRLDIDGTIPPQQCEICGQAFCHMYWGCRKMGCNGCLNLFKNMAFDNRYLSSLINDNPYESRVLKEYLESKGRTLQDVLQTCCQKLDSEEYHCTDSSTARLSSNTRTCYMCALRNFKELAYLYRTDIPHDDLPDEVTSRRDCYWGKNCRTQKSKPSHAERYNHICEQTRY